MELYAGDSLYITKTPSKEEIVQAFVESASVSFSVLGSKILSDETIKVSICAIRWMDESTIEIGGDVKAKNGKWQVVGEIHPQEERDAFYGHLWVQDSDIEIRFTHPKDWAKHYKDLKW